MLGIPRQHPDLPQGSPEWLAMRDAHVTGTAFAACLGMSKWDTLATLYAEKVEGVRKAQNNAMRIGSELEPVVREMVHQRLAQAAALLQCGRTPFQASIELDLPESVITHCAGLRFEPTIFTNQFESTPLMASLDGFAVRQRQRIGLEIKTANKDDHQVVIAGGVPLHYQPQVQSQIGIAELKGVLYASFHVATNDLRCVWVAPDADMQQRCWEGAALLWWHITHRVPPEAAKKVRTPKVAFDPLRPVGIDTRESAPLDFGAHPQFRTTLQTGDYTLAGYEEVAAVEWKTLGDLYHCVGADRDRFEQQWERLAQLRFGAVCIGASQHEILGGYAHSRVSPFAVLETLHSWSRRFNVPVWFCQSRTEAADVIKTYLLHFAKAHPLKVSAR